MNHLAPTPVVAGPGLARPAPHRRGRLRWTWLASLLLHLLPLLALLLLVPARQLPEPLPDAGFAVVFEGGAGQETRTTGAGPQPAPPPVEAAPAPPAAEAAPEAATPEATPEPAAPEETTGPPTSRPSPPPAPPRISLVPPPDEGAAAIPPFRMPEPPPPLPPARSPYAGLRVLPANPFATPRPAPAPPRRGLDLALGPVMPAPRAGGGQEAPESSMSMRGAEKLGADWRAAFRAWLDQHSRYPEEAAMMGQEGPVTVRFTVDRYGKVGAVELIRRSGSMYLDVATLALLRGRTLPPFPEGTAQDHAEIDLTIDYILIRR